MDRPSFSLSLPGSTSPPVDVFGLWTPAAQPPSTVDTAIGAIWRADLPEDPDAAFDSLEERQAALSLGRRALPAAEQRLSADLRAISQAGAGGASFALDGEPLSGPRGVLAAGPEPLAGPRGVLAAGPEPLSGPRGVLAAALQNQGLGVSYGLFDHVKIDPFQLEEAALLVSRFGEQVRRTVDQLALVETSAAGRKVGITRAAWSGDVETWWAAGAGSDRRKQHEQVLAQALATRQGWLRFLLVAASGITRVAAALATGPFSLVSVWAAWNYVQEMVKEYQKLAAVRPPAQQGDEVILRRSQ